MALLCFLQFPAQRPLVLFGAWSGVVRILASFGKKEKRAVLISTGSRDFISSRQRFSDLTELPSHTTLQRSTGKHQREHHPLQGLHSSSPVHLLCFVPSRKQCTAALGRAAGLRLYRCVTSSRRSLLAMLERDTWSSIQGL